MVSTIYVVRHGLRANDAPSPTGIDGDVRITKEGEFQAVELAKYVETLDPRPEKIYSSPFYRCLQTISPTAEALDLPIHVETGIGEYYHVDRPTHPIPLTADKSIKTFPRITLDYTAQISVSKTGETRDRLWPRIQKALDAIIRSSANVEAIIICTHAATKIAIGKVLANVEVRSGTCSMDEYVLSDGKWQCVMNGNTSFLSSGEQMHWDFSMAYEAGSIEDEKSRGRASNQEETVKVYVPLDLGGQVPLEKTATSLQATDLDTTKPLVQFNDTVFEGSWQGITGTEVYTTPDGDYIGKTRERIVLNPIIHENLEKTSLREKIAHFDRQKRREAQHEPDQVNEAMEDE